VSLSRLKTARLQLEAASAHLQLARDVNANNLREIDRLKTANGEWSKLCAAKKSDPEKPKQIEKRRKKSLVKAAAEREQIYVENADARAWSATVVPVAIVERLRKPAGAGGDGDG